jgi:hypothetical protein
MCGTAHCFGSKTRYNSIREANLSGIKNTISETTEDEGKKEMKTLTSVFSILFVTSLAQAAPCTTAPLTTYLNSGNYFACTENSGALNVEFNHPELLGLPLPSYVGLSLLGSNNLAADPAAISVIPGSPGLAFHSAGFTNTSTLLISSQAELVHFLLDAGTDSITSSTLTLDGVSLSAGLLNAGAALAIGQEILCVGGTFTSLPTGIVTGVLGAGAFGCNGAVVSGTAFDNVGLLSLITGTLGLPDLTGLTDTAILQLGPLNNHQVDVIKLQALVAVGINAKASDTGFGNTYTITSGTTGTPEPGSWMLMLAAGVLLAGNKYFGKLVGIGRKTASVRG